MEISAYELQFLCGRMSSARTLSTLFISEFPSSLHSLNLQRCPEQCLYYRVLAEHNGPWSVAGWSSFVLMFVQLCIDVCGGDSDIPSLSVSLVGFILKSVISNSNVFVINIFKFMC